jgi:macrolide transport system ATP-binding/permease protein
MGEWWRRVWYLLNRRRLERELELEMAAHREMMDETRRFGNMLKLREQSRDIWGWNWLDGALWDLRDAFRALRRAPSVSVTAVLILSAGIGLNLTFFHLLNVTALQPLAVADPATLVRLERRGKTFSSSGVPFPATQFIRQNNDVLSAVLTYHPSDIVWDGDRANKVDVAFVSANWFTELGYDAALGRVFSEVIDERGDAEPVVIVSHEFWRTRLGSDPRTVGGTLRLNDRVATIIGVAPPFFPDLDLQNPQMWLPIQQIDYFEPGNAFKETWGANNTELYARLLRGVSPAAATEGLRASLAGLAGIRPNDFQADEWLEAATAETRFLHSRDRQKLLSLAALFGGLTLLVLLVASANLANLVLSQAISRTREFSVRMALGASRWRILRHIVVECGILAVAGALGGIAVAYGSARLMGALTELPPYLDFTPDGRLFAAAFSVASLAMLTFGLVPAWMVSRRELIGGIRDGGHQASIGLSRARFRVALVGAQVVGCCALLVVAGSMARGLQRLLVTEPGFAFERVALLDPSLGRHGLSGDAAQAYWAAVEQRLASHPDVEQLVQVSAAPLGGAVQQSAYGADSGRLSITVMRVGPSFFSMLDIPLLAGRAFSGDDDGSAVIISRRVAMTMYGTLDVLGKGYPRTRPTRTIVGVAADAMVLELRASNSAEEYMPLGRAQPGAVLLVKSRTNPRHLLVPLYEAARAADTRVQPTIRLLADLYQTNLRAPRLASTIAGLVALLVLTLACFGIFGVVAYAVKLRAKEIGIRRALGADAPRVFATLLRQLAWPAGVGMVVGTTAGLVASRLLGGAPFHLAVTDAMAPTAALSIFALAGLAAALLPASRAMKDNPVDALRHE